MGVARRGEEEEPVYLRSRRDAEVWLAAFFDAESKSGGRVLATFDFPFGYPTGFAAYVTGKNDPLALWSWLASRIEDDEKGRNNRFEVAEGINALSSGAGPFWGKPNETLYPRLPYRKTGIDYAQFAERRRTDLVAKASSSCFQLFFNPTVGSQSLTGLPVLYRLRTRGGVAVWPFEDWDTAPIVFAEIWPGLIEAAVGGSTGEIRDARQVRLLSKALSLIPSDDMAQMMSDVPDEAREEAWILGAGQAEKLTELAMKETQRLKPPRLKNDCFALPPGVDWTPVDKALQRLKGRLRCIVNTETRPLTAAQGVILAEDAIALRSNPPAANTAVDGYGFAHASTGDGDQILSLHPGRAAAGAPFEGTLPAGQALKVMTGALLPTGVDTVVLEEDVSSDGSRIAFEGPVKPGANTRKAGEDVRAGDVALAAPARLGPAELAVLQATGITEVTVFRSLRVGVLSTGDELAAPDETSDPARTYDANRPMLLALLSSWQMHAVDLGQAPDNREDLCTRLNDASKRCDAILTSGGASAGDEDHVSALLKETDSLGDWRIALKPGRPLALGMWNGVPIFGLPGNPVAAMVCTLIFARPALGLLGGEGWREPQGFTVPAAFAKSRKPGRREYLRARMTAEGTAEVFHSEGSGRISGLSWADGLVELPDEAVEITPGTPVRYLPYTSFA